MFIPDPGYWFFNHPKSRDQKGTRSRIRIRNTGYDYKTESMRTLPAVGDRRVEPEEQPDDEQGGEDDAGQETGNPGRKQTWRTNVCSFTDRKPEIQAGNRPVAQTFAHLTGNVYTVLLIRIVVNADSNLDLAFLDKCGSRVLMTKIVKKISAEKLLFL
jgi:hypothetical protein